MYHPVDGDAGPSDGEPRCPPEDDRVHARQLRFRRIRHRWSASDRSRAQVVQIADAATDPTLHAGPRRMRSDRRSRRCSARRCSGKGEAIGVDRVVARRRPALLGQGHRAAQDLRRPGGRSRSRTRGCSARSRTRAASSRSPTSTRASSSPTCRTSCARRSTRSSAFPRCCSSGMFGELNDKQDDYLKDIHSLRPASADADQRHPRPVEGRGRAHGARAGDVRRADRAIATR